MQAFPLCWFSQNLVNSSPPLSLPLLSWFCRRSPPPCTFPSMLSFIIRTVSIGCDYARRAFFLLPVFLVFILIGLDVYSFNFEYAIQQPHSSPFLVFLSCLLFDTCVFLLVWSYLRSILTSSAVKDNPPPSDYYSRIRSMYPGQSLRSCMKCDGAPKPLRAHHCSICSECILKMDHHW